MELNMLPWIESKDKFSQKYGLLPTEEHDIDFVSEDFTTLANFCGSNSHVQLKDISSLVALSKVIGTDPVLIILPGTKIAKSVSVAVPNIKVLYGGKIISYVDYCFEEIRKLVQDRSIDELQSWLGDIRDEC